MKIFQEQRKPFKIQDKSELDEQGILFKKSDHTLPCRLISLVLKFIGKGLSAKAEDP
jgi:hypothetical protein